MRLTSTENCWTPLDWSILFTEEINWRILSSFSWRGIAYAIGRNAECISRLRFSTFSLILSQHLDAVYQNRWIDQGGTQHWPPNLNSLDFFSLKCLVYNIPFGNIEKLRNRIIISCVSQSVLLLEVVILNNFYNFISSFIFMNFENLIYNISCWINPSLDNVN